MQITARKVADLARHETCEIRGRGRVRHESAIDVWATESAGQGFGQVPGEDYAREFAAIMAEECQRLFQRLKPDFQRLTPARMEGYSNVGIAQQAGRYVRTVEWRLHLIRKKWEREMPQ